MEMIIPSGARTNLLLTLLVMFTKQYLLLPPLSAHIINAESVKKKKGGYTRGPTWGTIHTNPTGYNYS